MRNAYNILVGKPKGKRPLGDSGVDGKIKLEWILSKLDRKVWTGCIRLRIWTCGVAL
jgi:hypothetical protein